MKRIVSLMLAVFMMLSVAPLSLAVPKTKDAELDAVLNAEGSNLEFVNDETHPWIITEIDGVSYAESAIQTMGNTSTSITTTTDIAPYSKLTFDYIVSSEGNYDKLTVTCVTADGTSLTIMTDSGLRELQTKEYTFTEVANPCTLKWTYSKDSSVDRNDDLVRIRNIQITPPSAPTAINIVESDLLMMPNMRYDLGLTYEPEGAYAEITWESSSDAIATVENGSVKAHALGDVTITARCGDLEASINITVTNDVPYVDGFRSRESGYEGREAALVRHWFLGRGEGYIATFSQDLRIPNELSDIVSLAKSAEYYDGLCYVVLDKTLYSIDITDRTYTEICTYENIDTVYELSYDYANNRMLAWVRESTSSEYIGEVNLETGEMTVLTSVPTLTINAFAVATDGTAYVVLRGAKYSIGTMDLTTGQSESLFETTITSTYYSQSITYDHNTGKLYWASPSYLEKGFYEVDLDAQTVTLMSNNSGMLLGMHVGAFVDVYDEEAPVTGVSLDKSELTIEMGKTGVLVATIEPDYAGIKDVIWESSNEEVATVSGGVVRGESVGTAVITVRTVDGDFTATCDVTVIEPLPVAVTGISLSRPNATIKLGRTLQLIASVSPYDAANKNILWSSSNDEIATVTTEGLVEAIAAGNAVITATTEDGGFTATCDITVQGPIDPNVYPLYQDFEDGPDGLEGWTFIDADGDGNNWGLKTQTPGSIADAYEGDDMITSRSYTTDGSALYPDNWMISPEFTINENVSEVVLSWISGSQSTSYKDHYSVYIGSGAAEIATFSAPSAFLFEESAGSMATQTVDLTAYAGQTVRIAFRHHDSPDKLALFIDLIKVEQTVLGEGEELHVTGFALDMENAYVTMGTPTTITGVFEPANATNKNITWESADNGIATVENGVVTGVSAGTTLITATTEDGGFTATCRVVVRDSLTAPDANKFPVYEDFENDFSDWTNVDSDGDGYKWKSMRTFSSGGIECYEGEDMITSQSFVNANPDTGTSSQVLYPDNWFISPEFTISADATEVFLAWIAGSQDPDFLDHYSVYIGTGYATPASFTTVLYTGDAPGSPAVFTADLSAYAGQTVRIAFRHHESGDCYMLNIDTIAVVQNVESVPVTGVTLNMTSADLEVGDTLTLVATVSPANATNKAVTWTSSNNAVATVENGVVTAVSEGTATITVTTVDGGYTYFCIVSVEDNTPTVIPVTGVTLNMTSVEMTVGDTEFLVATVLPANATNKNYTWSSSNDSVAQIINGLVAAVGVGTANITVTTEDGGFTATCVVTVVEDIPETIPVTGVILDTREAEVLVGDTLTLTATVLPANATNKNVIWATSNEDVATVEGGVVTAVSAGTAIITVVTVDGSFSAICTITVVDPVVHVNGITLDVESEIMIIGAQLTITATVTPEDATNKNIIWETSDETVATVENGVVTALAYGEVTITAKTEDGEFTASCTIKVCQLGDVTGDGTINTGDAVAILRLLANLGSDGVIVEVADVNCDGKINTGDAVAILRKIAGLD